MAETEPERLSLKLYELLERRATLRAIVEQAIQKALTEQERDDIRKMMAKIDKDIAELEQTLKALQAGAGGGGTG
jgi:hypothetical protein